MTLIQATDEPQPHPNSFYNPISTTGYLTPLQRKKLREKRNLSLPTNVADESKVLNKPRSTPKGIKKAKTKTTPKLKPKEKVIKKVLKQKDRDSFPQLQCSISELVGQNKDDNSKEKRFFKNRSPQHLKKAKFVMPLTCRKGLDFIPIIPSRPTKVDIKEQSCTNSTMETSTESMQFDDSFETSNSKNQSNYIDEKVSSSDAEVREISTNQSSISDSSSSCQVSENLENTDNINSEDKGKCDIFDLFEFDWPSDEVLLEREKKARAALRESLAASKSNTSSGNLNESSTDNKEASPVKKLFPIFSKVRQTEKEQTCKQSKLKRKSLNILDNSKGSEQLIIDAGQKEIGAKICTTCGMIYTIGQEEDEKLHAGYHQTYLINLKFSGWKQECVIGNYMDGRIIQVKDTDEHFKTKKIKDILLIVNRDLGFSTSGLPSRPNVMILLFYYEYYLSVWLHP